VSINNEIIPESSSVRYLGIHLDKTLNWKEHIVKRGNIDAKIMELFWLLGRKSHLNLENKILIYNTVIKPRWTFGIEL
jgi:hypothetical protein